MEIQTLVVMVVSEELNPRLEVEEGPGGSGLVWGGGGRWHLSCSGNWGGRPCASQGSWPFFQLQNRGETHVQSDVQDSDRPRVEVLPWTLGDGL